MGGSGHAIAMIKSLQMNRALRQRTRKKYREKLEALREYAPQDTKRLNTKNLKKYTREEKEKLKKEIRRTIWEDRRKAYIKTCISLIALAVVLYFMYFEIKPFL